MSESVEITLPSSGNLIDESTHEQKLWLSNRTLSEPSGRFDPMPNKLSVLQAVCLGFRCLLLGLYLILGMSKGNSGRIESCSVEIPLLLEG